MAGGPEPAKRVDHVRRVMKDREGATADEFERRKVALRHDVAVLFFHDLRNYTLHRALPPVSYYVRLPDPGEDAGIDAEVRLDVASLQDWDNWRRHSHEVLRKAGSILQPLLDQHAARMIELNQWQSSRDSTEPSFESGSNGVRLGPSIPGG